MFCLADVAVCGACEGSALKTEKFAFKGVRTFGEGVAVERYERGIFAFRELVDAAGDVFLAGACLAADKDCCCGGGDLADELAHFAHFARVPDEFAWNAFNDVADFLAFDLVLDFDGFEVLF